MPEMSDVREFAENWVDQAESFHQKEGSKFSTPEGILKHPDLLEGGCGWNRLMPRSGNLSVYKNYLEQYYLRNCAESVAQAWQNEQVYGLTPLVSLSKNGSVAEACRDKQEAYANSIGDGSVLSQNVNGSATQACRHEQEAYAAVIAIQSGLAPLVSLCVKMEKQVGLWRQCCRPYHSE
ncbi:uncharacterized protein [Miscanthus floridulus]|uniref:uncharacterized protein isoform X4 n=1 Tax=Miscanthus floridulus TaxID=154761 RepID=UPI003459A77F